MNTTLWQKKQRDIYTLVINEALTEFCTRWDVGWNVDNLSNVQLSSRPPVIFPPSTSSSVQRLLILWLLTANGSGDFYCEKPLGNHYVGGYSTSKKYK